MKKVNSPLVPIFLFVTIACFSVAARAQGHNGHGKNKPAGQDAGQPANQDQSNNPAAASHGGHGRGQGQAQGGNANANPDQTQSSGAQGQHGHGANQAQGQGGHQSSQPGQGNGQAQGQGGGTPAQGGGLPPGLAKRGGNLPPGLQRYESTHGGALPPGLQNREGDRTYSVDGGEMVVHGSGSRQTQQQSAGNAPAGQTGGATTQHSVQSPNSSGVPPRSSSLGKQQTGAGQTSGSSGEKPARKQTEGVTKPPQQP